MTTTNWLNAEMFQTECPHTFNAVQHLVMSMAVVSKNQWKKSLFGRDKGLAAYKTFEEKLGDSVLAMVLDGAIERNAPASEVREKLILAIELFASAFPNWPDAYLFADSYFIGSATAAEDRISSIMS